MVAKQAMVTELVTLKPTDTVDVAARLMIEQDVAHLPVVNDEMQVLGVVTEVHMVRMLIPSYVDLLDGVGFLPDDFEPFEHSLETAGDVLVTEIMSKEIDSADENAPLPSLASRMLKPGVRRILIVRDGKLIGTVGRRDILKEILAH